MQKCSHATGLLSAGFPCNSYSPQGSGRGLQDTRGQVLLSVLRLAWQLQAPGLLLECVPEVQEHVEVRDLLQTFASHMGMKIHQVVLELGDQWISRRCRWWCAMLPQGMPSFQLTAWPQLSPKPVIGDEISQWPEWPIDEELALAWTEEEAQKYGDPTYGNDCRRLNICAQAPTALRSWGAALRACPCGCRLRGFSEQSLQSRKLRGFGIFSGLLQGYRFPHPAEVGFLNTLPPDFCHLPDPRAALVLVGQLAAPLQSLWVTARSAVGQTLLSGVRVR